MPTKHTIGILGGTFDPIHLGHITPTLHLAKTLQLDTVYLMPANIPPHKPQPQASSVQRVEMAKLICKEQPIFVLDDRELHRTRKSYSIDSIKELKAENPDTTLCFFIGTDSLLTLSSWYLIDEILALCHFVVSTRPGYVTPPLEKMNKGFYSGRITKNIEDIRRFEHGKILLIDTPQVDISSTEIRQRLKHNESCQQVLSGDVAQYIKKQGLYN